ncbi:rubrerythrin [Marichromatium purpuratum 984]|uniref:Rubrerythrin n=1 Tax=Marichromatium purpuratum 984 TaxID=765910 RepID=W0E6V4_MARPU|nr:hypothetical protein [Marichromatium purpuratum]AHF04776.1 rubrerythrin [Marichromatium purpuratum 984]
MSAGPEPANSLAALLAHALELEHASHERYTELAAGMALHHNQPAAAAFRRLAEFAGREVARVEARTQGVGLPCLAPWEFDWSVGGTELVLGGDLEQVDYLMDVARVLELGIRDAARQRDFYAAQAARATTPAVRDLAAELTAASHARCERITQWRVACATGESVDDWDPPNLPE